MLTRLKVNGFKNLDHVDVHFGPFTCIAGPNGVGKSNLFDAIMFLSALAARPLMDAAQQVRGGDARLGDVASLFRRSGDQTTDRMDFEVELLIPAVGEDALGQPAEASMTFLRYELGLRYRSDDALRAMGTLEVAHESMVHINRSEAKASLPFHHKKAWRESVVRGRRTSPYISTEAEEDGLPIVALHADSQGGQSGGRPRRVPAASLPRTMLSSVSNAAEHRTLVLARQEMVGWTQLQLEPSALRAPDGFNTPSTIGQSGAHLPAALYSLARAADRERPGSSVDVYARVANRLSELVENVRRITVDVDERRQLLSIVVTDRHGTDHVASALSDGTLRFLALTVMEADPRSHRLLCLEEPENGMHPMRIPAVIRLLRDLAVDVDLPVDEDNPLRQVIINTHSPTVVACVADSALLVAQEVVTSHGTAEESRLTIRHLSNTWRASIEPVVTRGDLLAYLNPFVAIVAEGANDRLEPSTRVLQRPDLQMPLRFETEAPTE